MGRATDRSTVALEMNRMLDKIRVKINTHYQEIMDRDNFVTAEKVKNAFLGLEHRCHTLMKIYEQFTADYAKMVEAGMKSKKSYEKYIIVYKHLKEFLMQRYHVQDIALKELTQSFIMDFDMFLRTGQALLQQYRVDLRLSAPHDGFGGHQQRVAGARPFP